MQAPQPQYVQQLPEQGNHQFVMSTPSTNATVALVLSILGIIFSFIYGVGICFAIPGLILANGALSITNQFPGHPDAGVAKAAKICSQIAIGLFIVVVVLVVLAGVLYVWASSLAEA